MIGRHLVCDECNDHCYDAYFDAVGRPKLTNYPDYSAIYSHGKTLESDIVGTDWTAVHHPAEDDALAIVTDHYCSDCR
jgi:hypothetical protein